MNTIDLTLAKYGEQRQLVGAFDCPRAIEKPSNAEVSNNFTEVFRRCTEASLSPVHAVVRTSLRSGRKDCGVANERQWDGLDHYGRPSGILAEANWDGQLPA